LPFNNTEALEEAFKKQGNEIAAVIVEGIQGVGGINVAEKNFLQAIRNNCDQHGSVYIADSVQCGYGRSGIFFSHDHAGVEADIYSMAKGMGNGFPIGGIIISPSLKSKHGMLGTTFGGNHLACAAALAVLEVIEKENLIQHASKVGEFLSASLQSISTLSGVRGMGLMIGFDVPEQLKNLKKDLLFKHRIFTGEAKPNVIRLLPSLALSMEDAAYFIQQLKLAIEQYQD
jgi:acetylornithine aminotransferase